MQKFVSCFGKFQPAFLPERPVFMAEYPSAGEIKTAQESVKAKAPELEKKGEDFKAKLDAMSDEDIQKLNVETEAKTAKDDIRKKIDEIMNNDTTNPKLGEGRFYANLDHQDLAPLREARDKALATIDKAQEDFKEKQKEITDAMALQRDSRLNAEVGFKTMAGIRTDLMAVLDSDPDKLKMEDINALSQKLTSVEGLNNGLANTIYANLQDNLAKIDEMKFKDSLGTVSFAREVMAQNFKSFEETFNLVANDSQLFRSAAGFVEGMKLRAQANAQGDAAKFDQAKIMTDTAKQAVDRFKLRDIRIGVPGAAPAEAPANPPQVASVDAGKKTET